MIRPSALRASLLLGALLTAGSAQAETSFVMPDDDGYGVGECLAGGPDSACGKLFADAWCESKGFARAAAFGRADPTDATGSTPAARPASARPQGLVTITCRE